jgi:hypothetical protein
MESSQEQDASVTVVLFNTEVAAKVTFTASEKDPAYRVRMAVAEFYSLHRNLKLDFINVKPKRAIKYLVSVIKLATLKALIERN